MNSVFAVLNPAAGTPDQLTVLLQLLWFFFFIMFFFLYPAFGQRMQLSFVLRDIERKLGRLKLMKDEVRERTIESIKRVGESGSDPTQTIDSLIDYFYIPPEAMDPYGVVYKLEHILEVGDNRFEEQVAAIAPKAEPHKVKSLTNLVEVARALNIIYRIVRHYYLIGKKTSNYFVALQIQMILPQIMEIAEAYRQASFAFMYEQPIGDGVGALVAAKFVRESRLISSREIARDTTLDETEFEGRRIYVIRAVGPGGTVGRPGEAVKRVLSQVKDDVKLIITVDAALKLEGEETGKIAEGVGVAIGGPGVDKFKIESIAKDANIPLYAMVIYQSIAEAITPMRESIAKAADIALNRVKALIREKVPENSGAILAGIGNTIGIGK